MSDERTAEKIDDLVAQLKKIRVKSGMMLEQVAEKCAPQWGVAVVTASQYIRNKILDAQVGWTYALFDTNERHKVHRRDIISHTMDYLTILGCPESEKRAIFRKLKAIYPDIKYPQAPTESLNSFEGLGQFKGYKT